MIDIHSHILYGLDDGAQDRDTSLAMLSLAAETGTTDIVATPHSDSHYVYEPTLVDERIAELNELTGNRPRIHRGCDFHLSIDNVQACLVDHTPYTINGLCYLMVEFAEFFVPPSTENVLRELIDRGIVPVITHPERNPVLRESTARLERWIGSGCAVQITAQSLTDRFGREARDTTWSWLRKGMVHVLASDAHDPVHRPPRLDLAHTILTEKLGEDVAELLLVANPGAIIRGDAVMPMTAADLAGGGSKKWFQFWR
jgi:protein-tyrosine phosphatase